MTHLENIKNILTEANISFEQNLFVQPNGEKIISLIVDGGYIGFYTGMNFDESGKLISIEAYES